jgi:hypothetical protein
MPGELFRFRPLGPAAAYKTYGIKAPLATHWRRASCAEVGCPAYLNGWVTIVPVQSPQAQYIRAGRSGRHYSEATGSEQGMTEFRFQPGQPCFRASEHRVPLEREPIYTVRPGDWRGSAPGASRRHQRAADWVDDFGTHQQAIADRHKKG